jgi:hypothetical protein
VIATATSTYFGYLASWNTSGVPDGSYTLQSLATDEAGNTTYSAAVSISVDNTPPVTAVTVPVNNKTLTGTAAVLKATATDNVSVKTVQFVISGGSYTQHAIGTGTLTKGVYKLTWNTTTVANGTYTLQSVATDEAGNVTSSTGITIKVSN